MSEQSSFSKKNIIEAAAEPKRDFLDELHLPPQVTSFLRENARLFQIVAVCIVLAVIGWTSYQHYTETRRGEAASMLTEALQQEDQSLRIQNFKSITEKYSGTEAATWSTLELAHLDYDAGNYDDAISKYNIVLGEVGSKNALYPIVQLSIAQTYEQKQDYVNAISNFETLASIPGFEGEGYLAMGRIYEITNDNAKAIQIYEKYLSLTEGDAVAGQLPVSPAFSRIKDKLVRLRSSEQGSAN